MTEDYELGLRIGALGLKTMFVRIPAQPGERGVVASRGHFPATLGAAVRQKARWLGGIALAGWDGSAGAAGSASAGCGCATGAGRSPRCCSSPLMPRRLLWSQLWLAEALGAPVHARLDPALRHLLTINGGLLAWRILMRACFTASAYGWREGLLSIPRLVVGNVIAMLAAARAVSLHLGGGARGGTRPATSSRPSCRNEAVAAFPRRSR